MIEPTHVVTVHHQFGYFKYEVFADCEPAPGFTEDQAVTFMIRESHPTNVHVNVERIRAK